MRTVPLTAETLDQAVRLITTVFPPEYEEESSTDELRASLDPVAHREFLVGSGITTVQYWTAMIGKKLVGIIGLYTYEKDEQEADWLGWFCVAESSRKRSIGTKLLLFTIELAKRRGKSFLRLYTTDGPDELDAHRLYERYGFRVVKRKPWTAFPELGLTEIFYELELTKCERCDIKEELKNQRKKERKMAKGLKALAGVRPGDKIILVERTVVVTEVVRYTLGDFRWFCLVAGELVYEIAEGKLRPWIRFNLPGASPAAEMLECGGDIFEKFEGAKARAIFSTVEETKKGHVTYSVLENKFGDRLCVEEIDGKVAVYFSSGTIPLSSISVVRP